MKRSLIWLLPILLSVVGGLLVAAAFPPWTAALAGALAPPPLGASPFFMGFLGADMG